MDEKRYIAALERIADAYEKNAKFSERILEANEKNYTLYAAQCQAMNEDRGLQRKIVQLQLQELEERKVVFGELEEKMTKLREAWPRGQKPAPEAKVTAVPTLQPPEDKDLPETPGGC